MRKIIRNSIAKEFRDCVLKTIERLDNTETNRPFHAALLPDEALFWSRFERSFSTSFGQRVIEEISSLVATAGGAMLSNRQKITDVKIDSAIDDAITTHLRTLRQGHRGVWENTLMDIKCTPPSGQFVEHRIISDLWWVKNGIEHYMSIKTVKPNIDQTAVAKGDLLRLAVADPSCKVYFGLYYNPYGEGKASYAHKPPMGIFDFHHDDVVLIGKEYWDTLGGSGCYEEILDIAKVVGAETRVLLENLHREQR